MTLWVERKLYDKAMARIKELEARKTDDYDEILALRESDRVYARQVKELKRSVKKHEDTWDQSMLAWTNEKAKLNLKIDGLNEHITDLKKAVTAVSEMYETKNKDLSDSLNRVVSLSMIYLDKLNKLGWEVRDDPEKGPTLVARS